ncbi:MAG TPA: septal ring lytic transglycosylase RlpA family protein [Nitrospirota bacterium]|nr:septal ring lytic transglycosylase RlpA family protein [Nitrospirota bacterium]
MSTVRMVKRIILLLCCTLVLSACGVKRTNVARPPEPSRRGTNASQRPYTVYGQRYEPLESHEGFVQTGVASWYGKDFHGKTTSNGEIYDMNAMTAAHKTLPLGVYVKVYNRDNGREAIVRINDRGPFVKGRIIDLSYGAAKKLGIDVAGTASVRIEALGYRVGGPAGREEYSSQVNYDAGNYTVQVGAFKDYQNAVKLSEEMKKAVGFSEIHPAIVYGELFYRVYAGNHTSLKSAEAAETNFSEHGYPGSFVVSLD